MNIVIEEYGRVIVVAITAIIIILMAVNVMGDRLTVYANENLAAVDAKRSIGHITITDENEVVVKLRNVKVKKGDAYDLRDLFETVGEEEAESAQIRIIDITDPNGIVTEPGEDEIYSFSTPGKYVISLSYHGLWAFNLPVTL